MAFIDRNASVTVLKYAQVRHMKELRRAGVNPTAFGFPAGSNVRIRKGIGTKGGRGY